MQEKKVLKRHHYVVDVAQCKGAQKERQQIMADRTFFPGSEEKSRVEKKQKKRDDIEDGIKILLIHKLTLNLMHFIRNIHLVLLSSKHWIFVRIYSCGCTRCGEALRTWNLELKIRNEDAYLTCDFT